jgi:membrane-bound lytic murein transglycosylase D
MWKLQGFQDSMPVSASITYFRNKNKEYQLMRKLYLPVIIAALFLGACSNTPTREQTGSSRIPHDTHDTPSIAHIPGTDSIENPATDATAGTEKDAVEYDDIWVRIQKNLSITRNLSHPSTRSKLKFYSTKQQFMDRIAERATPYIYYIVEELEKRNMPLDLALLPIVESAYQPFAHSPSRAAGIWQFIPGTGKHYGLKQNAWYDGRRDIVASTDAALNYLQKLHNDFNGDWLLALAAYNAGEGNVGRAVAQSVGKGKNGDFWSLQLKNETLGYVPSLMAVAEIVANPEKYNISLKPIANKPYFEIVDTGGQIDLATVAQLTGLSLEEIYILNPGINKWATDPDGPHHLLIPVNKAAGFRQQLAALPQEERMKWQMIEIRNGDTLAAIAGRYRTDVNTIKSINNLKNNNIHAGRTLLIPVSRQPLEQYALSQDARSFSNLKRSRDGQSMTYTIKRGDNLWDIGQRYGVTVEQLCAWNGLSKNSVLTPGKTLTLWSSVKAEIIPVAAYTVSSEKQEHITYTVKQGDSLWIIARRHGVSVDQLQKWNGLNKRATLRPGQNLDIYTGTPPADA